MKTISRKLFTVFGVGAFVLAGARLQADPTAGFTQYSSTYNVQNWTSGCGGFSDLGGGEFETWVCAGESRVEMRWENWPNQNIANQFVCDAMFSPETQATAIHQIKSNTGGEVIYLQVQNPGTLRNDNGSVFLTGMANQWFHINSIFNPTTGMGYAYINGSLEVTRSYPTSDRAWYFKNGCYNNGLPTGGKSTAWFKNITTWAQSSSPDFSLSASPNSLTVTQGSGGSSTITVSPVNGFSGSVSLSASGLPSGVTASFNPSSTTSTSTLTLTASSTAATGTATVTITGTSGSLTHTTTISLTVNGTPNFSLSASPSSVTVTQGGNGASTITINPVNGYNNTVSLSASGLPAGVTASFNPASTTTSSTLTLTASSTATMGNATVTVTGTDGTLTHTTSISLTVNAASTNNFAGTFQIQNEASGLVLNNQGSTTNGSAITQWTIANSTNLDWTFIGTSNGYYQINSSKSGLDAVVQSASTTNGAKIIQWSLGSSGDDQWKPVANSDGSYTFYNLKSGLVLGDPGSSTNKTTQMDQETATGGSNQKWTLLKQ